jgi:DUF4097 and DUF4098 domain-containing protein YvlB
MRLQIGGLLMVALVVAAPARAQAQWQLGDQAWCGEYRGDSARYCEVRVTTLQATGALEVDGGPNGSIEVEAWDGNSVQVEARLTANARSQERADEIAAAVELIAESGRIAADGPRSLRRESWAVSHRVRVPRNTNLELDTTNGGIEILGVSGEIDFNATNGGVRLVDLSGNVRGHTTNGGLRVELTGDRWTGNGMDVRTTNGGVTLMVPDAYSAELEVGTTNGGIDIDFPVTIQGRIGRRQLSTTLGEGGSRIRAVTTNGGVRVVRR